MSSELVQVLGLLGVAIAMFVAGRPRLDAVALIMIVLLPMTGIIDMNEALARDELQAIIAHELGHEYVWTEYNDASNRSDANRMRELAATKEGQITSMRTASK